MKKEIHIVGAGLSGLSLAYFLVKENKDFDVTLYEKRKNIGGLIGSSHSKFGLSESAANAFMNSALLQEIAQDIGCELVERKKSARKKFIFYKKKMRQWPLSFMESLSFAFKLLKNWRKKAALPQENLEEWSERIFGAPFTQKVLNAAVVGIYATRPKDLSAPLVTASLFKKKTETTSPTQKIVKGSIAPKNGMENFIHTLKLFLIKNNAKFIHEKKIPWDTSKDSRILALATSASDAAKICPDQSIQKLLSSIQYKGLFSMSLFSKHKPTKTKSSFGCLFPKRAQMNAFGVLFNDSIFENRIAPPAQSSESWIIEDKGESVESVYGKITEDRKKLGFQSEILHSEIFHWPQALPIYSRDLEQKIDQLKLLLKKTKNFYLTGNYLGRIGLKAILEDNQILAKKIIKESIEK